MTNSNNKVEIDRLDSNMKANSISGVGFRWFSPSEAPFYLAGFPWFSKEGIYRRLPSKSDFLIPEAVNTLANYTAGGQIRFRTNSVKLAIRVKLAGAASMVHMPATGQCGFDCYVGIENRIRYCNTTKYDHTMKDYECILYELNEPKFMDIILNFPLYQGVEEVLIGLDEDAEVLEPTSYRSSKRVIFYGTSITQGGCASRPGMAYSNIISRRLNVECINLGFSGNGKGEPELARLMAEIDNPGCMVVDYEANAGANGILKRTLSEFVGILRSIHPQVPILVVSKIRYAKECILAEPLSVRLELLEYQRNMIKEIIAKGDQNIHFYDGSELLGEDFDECTVDGVHPTDLGFMRIADKLAPVIEKLMF